MSLNVGDWALSYSSGIWQIYRILTYKCRDPLTGNEKEKTTIFLKRFINKSFKRSFSEECCDPSFVKKLSSEELQTLNDFIGKNNELYTKFINYIPKEIDCIYNARIGIQTGKTAQEIESMIQKNLLISDFEISPLLEDLGFNTKEFPYWTVQFVSHDHQCKDGYLVFRFKRLLSH